MMRSDYSERSGSQDQGGHDRLPSCRVDFVERTGVVVETDSVKLTRSSGILWMTDDRIYMPLQVIDTSTNDSIFSNPIYFQGKCSFKSIHETLP